MNKNKTYYLMFILILLFSINIIKNTLSLWKITAYCSCEICCGNSADGITASGKKVKVSFCANNWLPFGTKVKVERLGIYIVEDRGSKKYFGTKEEKRKTLDIYFEKHEEAKKFGVKYLKVSILK